MYLTPRWKVPFDVTEKFDFKAKMVTKQKSISNRDDDDLCNSKLLAEKQYEAAQTGSDFEKDRKSVKEDRKSAKEDRKSFLKLVFNMLFVLNVFYFGVLVIRWNYFISRYVVTLVMTHNL